MAVDIKTLRIGSHILVNGKRERVGGIRPSKLHNSFQVIIQHEASDFSSFGYVPSASDMIEPIPITPEILTEIGFKYHEYDNGKLWEWDLPDGYKDYGYLEFDEDTTTIWRGRLWHMKEVEMEFKAEFLHELENIFYMFYGVELIKENKNN